MFNLHLATDRGSLASLIKISDVINQPEMMVAICDNSMYNVIDFYRRSVEAGKMPVIGLNANLAWGGVHQLLTKYGYIASNISLFAYSKEGYKNLVKLSTKGWLEGLYRIPRIDMSMLKDHNSGLLCVVPVSMSYISMHLANDNVVLAVQETRQLLDIFGNRLYLAVIANNAPTELESQFIRESQLPCIASNVAWYNSPEDYDVWKYMIAISQNKPVELVDIPNDFYIRTGEDITKCSWITEDMIFQTYNFLNRFEPYNLNKKELQLPDSGMTNEDFICSLYQKLKTKGLNKPEYIERLSYELDTICGFGYVDYFVLVSDIIDYVNRNLSGYWSAGRGSVGGCLVAYLLGITRIDPVNPAGFDMQIPFDRFLNSGRKVMPDIDLDFLPKDRDRIIEYLKEKYGDNSCKNMMTVTTMGARSAVRDVSRISGNLTPEIENIIKSFPHDQHLTLSMIEDSDIYIHNQDNATFTSMFQIAKKLEGVPKALGVHASGVAIANSDMTDYVPFFVHNDRIVTQYDQDQLDYLGIVKLDILGVNMLQIIADTMSMIWDDSTEFMQEAFTPKEILFDINIDDSEVYKFLNDGLITGVFQWDTYNYKKVIQEVRPSCFKDLVDLNTLGRSAALLSGLTEKYIARKSGREYIEPLHPRLKGLMKQTYELPLYQEQIMKIFIELAGYSFSEADDVRKAIGKKIPELMEKQRIKFHEGCNKNGITQEESDSIWFIIDKFTKYTWNLGHAMAYTQICYETAYLAYHYPMYFYCACINNSSSADDAGEFISTLKKRGIKIYNTDITKLNRNYEVRDGKVYAGLAGIKNISDKTIDKLKKAYNNWQTFRDFDAAVSKKDVNKTALLSLFCAGAFDDMFETEFDMECFLSRSGLIDPHKIKDLRLDQYSKCGRVAYSLKSLFPDHDDIQDLKEKPVVKIVAYVVRFREIYTKNHKKMGFVVIENEYGRYETTWFPESWKSVHFDTGNLYEMALQYDNGLIGLKASLLFDSKKQEVSNA